MDVIIHVPFLFSILDLHPLGKALNLPLIFSGIDKTKAKGDAHEATAIGADKY
jgi:hypothetical protein